MGFSFFDYYRAEAELQKLIKIVVERRREWVSEGVFLWDYCTCLSWNNMTIRADEKTLSNAATELQIDSKSASEESQVCIAISGLYISLSGLSWCYLKVTGPLWKKMLIEKNLSYGNILKIKISLVKLWFSKCYHRINFFLSIFFSTVVRSPLDNIMKDHSSLCRDLKWLYRLGILQMHFLNQSEALWYVLIVL